jgi:hypothetical protein
MYIISSLDLRGFIFFPQHHLQPTLEITGPVFLPHSVYTPRTQIKSLLMSWDLSAIREQQSSIRDAMTWMPMFVQLTQVDPISWTVFMQYLFILNFTCWSEAGRVMWGIPTWGPLILFIRSLETYTVGYARTNVIGSRTSFVIAYIEIHVFRGNPFQAHSLKQSYHPIQRFKQEKYNTKWKI